MDGLTLAREIKARADLPIIVLSAIDAGDSKADLLEEVAEDYVTKPYHYPELRARINRVLRRLGDKVPAPEPGPRAGPDPRPPSPRGDRRRRDRPADPDRVAPALRPRREPRPDRHDRDAPRPRLGRDRGRRPVLRLGDDAPAPPEGRASTRTGRSTSRRSAASATGSSPATDGDGHRSRPTAAGDADRAGRADATAGRSTPTGGGSGRDADRDRLDGDDRATAIDDAASDWASGRRLDARPRSSRRVLPLDRRSALLVARRFGLVVGASGAPDANARRGCCCSSSPSPSLLAILARLPARRRPDRAAAGDRGGRRPRLGRRPLDPDQVAGDDELARLADSHNRLAADLERRNRELGRILAAIDERLAARRRRVRSSAGRPRTRRRRSA